VLSQAFCPPGVKEKDFADWIFTATREPFSFLHINNKAALDKRYRRNIAEFLDIDTLR
jgi:hypothetical protein